MKTGRRRRDGMGLMEDVGRIVTGSARPAETLQRIVALVSERFSIDVCSIYARDARGDDLVLAATQGLSPASVGRIRMKRHEGLTGLVLETMAPVFVKHPERHPRYKFFAGSGEERFQTYLGLPLVYHGQTLGAVVMQTMAPDGLRAREIPLFSAVASQIAGALAYANLLESLEKAGEEGRDRRNRAARRQDALSGGGGSAAAGILRGIPASRGFGAGQARYLPEPVDFSEIFYERTQDPAGERRRFEAAHALAETQVAALCEEGGRGLSGENQAILQAYLMYLRDGGLKRRVLASIEEGYRAEYALKEVILGLTRHFSRLEDPYLRERGGDIEIIGRRILRNLQGIREDTQMFDRDTIVIATNLSPAEIIHLRQERLRGILLRAGGATSHAAILARSFGIPMVIGAGEVIGAIREGDPLLLDGNTGAVYPRPSAVVIREYRRLASDQARRSKALDGLRSLPAVTRDGVAVRLGANINLLSDLELVERAGADEIGLYRTEFPFLAQDRFPTEEEQADLYGRAVAWAKGRSVTIRTLDVGGDKFLSHMDYAREDNPFLGWRSIRVSLELQDMFREQLRAILRTSAAGPVQILFPMVSSLDEMHAILSLLEEEKRRLRQRSQAFDERMPVGILLEVPAAVWILDRLLPLVDFVSVGTNDLIQYTLAVDRNNPKVASLYNPLHPAVLEALRSVVAACRKAGKPLVVCGEAAANPRCTFLYLGMGIRNLSMSATSLPAVKQFLRNARFSDARQTIQRVWKLDRAADIEEAVRTAIGGLYEEAPSLDLPLGVRATARSSAVPFPDGESVRGDGTQEDRKRK